MTVPGHPAATRFPALTLALSQAAPSPAVAKSTRGLSPGEAPPWPGALPLDRQIPAARVQPPSLADPCSYTLTRKQFPPT